ncbi:MAG: hypothetical protein K0Q89_290 [Thermomicrobiales bacterium]|nr:hypothetical protein [Thermomicrobiales bacterium]
MTRSLIFVIITAAILLGLEAVGGVMAVRHRQAGAGGNPHLVVPDAGIGHPIYELDPTDDRALAAYATDIFIGRVRNQTGAVGVPTSAPGQVLPQSQFAVEVLQLIKGQAAGLVTVNQVGGLDEQARQMILLEGDVLLHPGASELFLTMSVPERGWYQIIAAGHGHLSADDPARRKTLVDRFTQAADDPIDFVRFNGAVYLSTAYVAEDLPPAPVSHLAPEDLGPAVGRVVTNWIDGNNEILYPNEPCSWETPDGTAPRLAPGDDIYAVRGYATTFRLAARQAGELVSYQVWCNDEAEVGADLFDIYDRVNRISVTADVSESSGFAVIEDRQTVARLVAMLLEGRVIPEELSTMAPVTHQLIFHLDDGSTFRASAAPGELLWGLGAVTVPAAFTETLDKAWTSEPGEEASD